MTLTSFKRMGHLFCRIFLGLALCGVSLGLFSGSAVLAGMHDVTSSVNSHREQMMSVSSIIGDVNFDRLVKVVSAKFATKKLLFYSL